MNWDDTIGSRFADADFIDTRLSEDDGVNQWVTAPLSEVALIVREALLSDETVERVARELASLDPEDEWPTNIELGGNPFTGTRDDEYRSGMREYARDVIRAAIGGE